MRALLLLLVSGNVLAGSALASWEAPTQNTDGTPIVLPLTYTLYGGVQGQPKVALATVSSLSYQHTTAPNGVTYCYQVTAIAGGEESAPTGEGCKVMVGLAVTVTTAYRMRLKVDGYDMVPLGTVPLGTSCVEGKTVDGLSPVPRDSVTLTSRFDTKPVVIFAKCG